MQQIPSIKLGKLCDVTCFLTVAAEDYKLADLSDPLNQDEERQPSRCQNLETVIQSDFDGVLPRRNLKLGKLCDITRSVRFLPILSVKSLPCNILDCPWFECP